MIKVVPFIYEDLDDLFAHTYLLIDEDNCCVVIDPAKDYRLTTIDYLLGGSDKMDALKKCRNVNAPKEASNNSRFIIMNYFREMEKQGKVVDAEIEGRIIVK